MKRLSALMALTALFPLAAAAQDASPPPPPPDAPPPPPPPDGGPPHGPPSAAERAKFEAMRQRFEQLHHEIRADVLGVLTPAQRGLLAQVVGDLALAPAPDVKGAISRLDAALSTSQKEAILNAVKTDMESMRAQMPHRPHPGFSPRPDLRRTQGFQHHHHAPDAGEVLLRVALSFEDNGPGGPWMHRGHRPWDHHGPGPWMQHHGGPGWQGGSPPPPPAPDVQPTP
ncbi:MAG TPA: hypothetical protein VME66_09240 [Candidatus Acidoferrales bacterium]|nr:hypothetical protein [Candidatus Acidoferrales bacterium]